MNLIRRISSLLVMLLCLPWTAYSQCQMEWSGRFPPPNQSGEGVNGIVSAMVVFDDGSGPALFVAGTFAQAGSVTVDNIARWRNGWSALTGGGLTGSGKQIVSALCVHDDGTGAALYAGGSFTAAGGNPAPILAKWNGSSWSAVTPPATTNSAILALLSYNGGLVAGGTFCGDGSNIAEFRLSTGWSSLAGSGLWTHNDSCHFESGGVHPISSVNALALHDNGDGVHLYAGGSFRTSTGTDTVRNFAKLGVVSGQPAWLEVAVINFGFTSDPKGNDCMPICEGTAGYLSCFALRPLSSTQNALVFGGFFSSVNGCELMPYAVAELQPDGIHSLGSGVDLGPTVPPGCAPDAGIVLALAWGDPGDGQALYAGGSFQRADGQVVYNIARYDGDTWSGVPDQDGIRYGDLDATVNSLQFVDHCGDKGLYVGGNFVTADTTSSYYFGKWACAVGCTADWNGDGFVNSQDFLDFSAAFFTGAADFNHDCVTNSQDFFAFLAAFFGGC